MPRKKPDLKETLKDLNPEQRALLLQKLKTASTHKQIAGIPKARPIRIEETTGAACYPASPAQKRMMFLHEFSNGSPVYTSPNAHRLKGSLDVGILAKALADLINRHDSLRTVFELEDDDLFQKVLPEGKVALEQVDLTGFHEKDQSDEPDKRLSEAVSRPIDLTSLPIFRMVLLRLGEDDHILLFLQHHIITDGWSMSNLYDELSAFYNARLSGISATVPDMPIQMPDYTCWQIDQLKSGVYDEHLAYWKEKLKKEPAPLDLRTDFPRPNSFSTDGNTYSEVLDTALVDELKGLARKENTTLFTVLAAAFKALIHDRTHETDLMVGLPTANRLRPEVEPLIGCLINTVVLRTDLSGNPRFSTLVERVRATALDAYSHQEIPFDNLVEQLTLKRYPGHMPLFQVHLNLQEFQSPKLQLDGIECGSYSLPNHTAKFDLSFAIERRVDGWRTKAEYRTDLFRESTIRKIMKDWISLLWTVCRQPDVQLSEILSANPAPVLFGKTTASEDTSEECLHCRFEQQAAKTPHARAIYCEGSELTYQELNERANQLADHLRELAVGPEVVVALSTDRSIEMVIGLIGILKAGGAYLPLDPDAPTIRNERILADSGTKVILAVSKGQRQFVSRDFRVLLLDDPSVYENRPLSNPVPLSSPDNLVYVLYTSGSTGEPKGVMVEHRHLDAYIKSVGKAIPFEKGTYGLLQPLTADASQTLLSTALVNGSCLHLIPRECALDTLRLSVYLREHSIDTLKITPSHLAALLSEASVADLLPSKVLILGGETLPVTLANTISTLNPSCRLWNHYGPTETTVGVLIHEVDLRKSLQSSRSIPIGKPLEGVSVSIWDPDGKPVPLGKRGEIVIGGKTVTRGYLNNPEKTAAVFVSDPKDVSKQLMVYRTGDQGRILPDGSVEFFGREDHQVKIRGFRIELGEIEAVLNAHPSVDGQVVVFRQDTDSDPRIDAYVSCRECTDDVLEGIREFLRTRLPGAMIPSTLTLLEEIPRTSMGKVDRKALPLPLISKGELDKGEQGSKSALQKLVLELTAEVLEVGDLRGTENFFLIGGHSLSAMKLINRIRTRLRGDIDLHLLFNNPVLDEFANALESHLAETASVPEEAVESEKLPVTPMQEGMLFQSQLNPEANHYIQQVVGKFPEAINPSQLREAWQQLLDRHAALRESFHTDADGNSYQVFNTEVTVPWEELDWTRHSGETLESRMNTFLCSDWSRSFQLEKAPLMRVTLIKTGANDYHMVWTSHHVLLDGWAYGPLLKELFQLYSAASDGQSLEPVDSPDLKPYLQWIHAFDHRPSKAFWRKQLSGFRKPSLFHDSTHDFDGQLTSFRKARSGRTLSRGLSDKLTSLADRPELSLNTLIQGAWALVVARCSNREDVCFGVIRTLRRSQYPRISEMVGLAVNTLPMRVKTRPGQDVLQWLAAIRRQWLELGDWEHTPVGDIQNWSEVPRPNQLFDSSVLFEWGSLEETLNELGEDWKFRKFSVYNCPHFPVSLTARAGKQLRLQLTFDEDLLTSALAARILECLESLLEQFADSEGMTLQQLSVDLPEGPLVHSNSTLNPETCLHHLFEKQASLTPALEAVVCQGESLSFRDLNHQANQFAHHLMSRGIGRWDVVAILLERSIELVVAMLGVLKAGGTYLTLDPDYPESRLRFLVDDSGAGTLIFRSDHENTFSSWPVCLISMDADRDQIHRRSSQNPCIDSGERDGAYLIYTSGSTGDPKGALVSHRAIVNHMLWMQERFPLNTGDAILQKTPVSFDASIWEFYQPLMTGARLVLADPGVHRDPGAIALAIIENRITTIQFVPLMLELFSSHPDVRDCQSLKRVFCGGDALPASTCQKLIATLDVEVINLYGPTEAAIDSTYWVYRDLPPEAICPIGKPITNVHLYVLDEEMNPVPDGEAGELFIAGAGLATGYVNRPELTAEKFPQDPFQSVPGERMYRTGDRVRRLPDGNLEYLGRLDFQVKFLGYRIEPGEIESAIRKHPGIGQCVTVLREDAPGDKRLVAYYTQDRGQPPVDDNALRSYLKGILPGYMVPSDFRMLPRFPETANGKLDRMALPKPDTGATPGKTVRIFPSDGLEETISGVFSVILGKRLGLHDDFFDFGGHSLLALRALSRLRETLGIDIPMKLVFDSPTPHLLADAILGNGFVRNSKHSPFPLTKKSYPREKPVYTFFEDTAKTQADGVAVEMNDERVSYDQLNRQANQLAHKLRSMGVEPDQLVGIFMDRSPAMIVAVLGVLKAGGACLPLDTTYPDARIATILSDALPGVVITNERISGKLPPVSGKRLDIDDSSIREQLETNPVVAVDPENLAYVLYTSGSTGTPKGVKVPHRTLQNLICWQMREHGGRGTLKTLQFASLNFDVSFQEIFATLSGGGALIMVDEATRMDFCLLANTIGDKGIERLFIPYVVLDLLAEELLEIDAAHLKLRAVITAGEQLKCTPAIRKLFKHLKGCVLINQYGPTETHVVTAHTLVGEPADWPALPPIGKPIANAHIYLLDEDLSPVANGNPGEIHVGGDPVAKGYLNREDLTAERFFPAPWDPDEFLYKTGDSAILQEDRTLQFLGRNDDQVKVRGFRIELGEIESRLMMAAGVRECVVITREVPSGTVWLVAYLIAHNPEAAPGSAELSEFLKKDLPEYMIPSRFIFLEKFPLNANGKVDRKALPDPGTIDLSEATLTLEEAAPTERRMSLLWMELLSLPRVGSDDNFFERGGHSLLATRLISRIRREFKVELPLRLLFEHPTISELSRIVEARLLDESSYENHPERTDGGGFGIEEEEVLPASFAQQRLWFIDRFEGGSVEYNIPFPYRMRGKLNRSALNLAVNEIVARHGTLRTIFREIDGDPFQVITHGKTVSIPIVEVKVSEGQTLESAIDEAVKLEVRMPFDLRKGPLVRFKLLSVGEGDYVLITTFHHVISDGWSMGQYFKELAILYNAFSAGQVSPLERLSIQYTDYTRWQRDWLQGGELDRQLAFWRDQLKDCPELDLPTDHKRPERMTHAGARLTFTLSAELSAKISEFNKSHRVTPFMSLIAAFNVLISRYTHQEDITVGTPIANRQKVGFEDLIGFFVNTLVIRTRLNGNTSFKDLVANIRENSLDVFQHQDLPFEKLVEDLNPRRELNRHPLFQVLFALQNAPGSDLELNGLEGSRWKSGSQTTHFDIELHMFSRETIWEGRLSYSTELFSRETIEVMADCFVTLLENLLDQPEVPLERISMLPPARRSQLLHQWNPSVVPEYRSITIHRLVEDQAEGQPEAIALKCDGDRMSYRELNGRANQVARFLVDNGVSREAPVGVCMERSLDLIVVLLGILKSGGAYLPIDRAYPADRIAFMLEDSGAQFLLVQEHLAGEFTGKTILPVIIDSAKSPFSGYSRENLDDAVTPDDLAYIIYTSGSTGRPKGVQVTHRNVARLLDATQAWFHFDQTDVWTLFHSYAFDFSVWEIWGALAHGGQLIIVPYDVSRSPGDFYHLLSIEKVTVLNQTPSAFKQLMGAEEKAGASLPLALRHVIFGGEALELKSLKPWFERHGDTKPRLVNMYGITETTVHVTYRPLSQEDLDKGSVIGQPIPDLQVYILDKYLEPVPIGVTGEIYVGGGGVARGYLNRPELNAERFLEDAFLPDSKTGVYRSGDLARRLSNGDIEYLGRADHQVQLRGFRVEVGEIESVLIAYPNFKDVKVLLREDSPGDQRLVAYAIPVVPGNEPPYSEIRAYAGKKLPDYMIPSAIVYIDTFKLTANGKLDTKALPAPEVTREKSGSRFVAPRNPREAAVCRIWETVLKVKQVGIQDSFFELGGHSLLATQITSRILNELGLEVPLRSLFQFPTIAELMDSLPDADLVPAPEGELSVSESGSREYPLSSVQERIWFIEKLEGGSQFHMPEVLRIRGALNVRALENALNALIARHDSLRTSFSADDGEVLQVVQSEVRISLPVDSLPGLNEESDDRDLSLAIQGFLVEPFDLGSAPILRVRLYRLGKDAHLLAIVLHHLVSDGWSMHILRKDLSALYAAELYGSSPKLPKLQVHYGDFSVLQRKKLDSKSFRELKEFWTHNLKGAPPLSTFPSDYPRISAERHNSGYLTVSLDPALSKSLREAGLNRGVTLFTHLLAVFNLLLARHTGQDDLVVGTPVLGRDREEYEDLIGCFLGTIPLRSKLDEAMPLSQYVRRLQTDNLEIFAKQDLPFEQLVRILQPERSLLYSPVFQVMFNFFTAGQDTPSFPGLMVDTVEGHAFEAKYDLTVYVKEEPAGICLRAAYNANLYDKHTISELVEQYKGLLEQSVQQPDEPMSAYSLVTTSSRNLLPDPGQPLSRPLKIPVTRQFIEAAKGMPDHPALVQDGYELSYGTLERASAAVASELIGAGLEPGEVVVLSGPRSLELVAGLVGILRSGGLLLLVDPTLPEARQSLMIEHSGARFWLDLKSSSPVSVLHELTQIEFKDEWLASNPATSKVKALANLPDPDPGSPAYIFFTSGTTGVPKGIIGNHKGLSHFLDWERSLLSVSEVDRVAQLTGLSFDVILRDVFLPLTSGATLCLPSASILPQSKDAVEWMGRAGITIVHTVPSVVESWLDGLSAEVALPSLRWALIAGEPLTSSLIQRWRSQFGNTAELLNLYGTTETTLAKTFYRIPDQSISGVQPIGEPMPETQVLILDKKLKQCGLGEPGQIAIRTPFMSSGYLKGSSEGNSRFIQNPYRNDPADKIYLTGDIGYYDSSGMLRILGRLDDQIKLHGIRVEPAEISALLMSHEGIRQAFVCAHEREGETLSLVAWYVPESSTTVAIPDIRAHLRNLIPEYMLPSAFVQMEQLPLNPNGKIDRPKLPPPDFLEDSLKTQYEAPRTSLETAISEIWASVLKVPQIGRNDNFFDLGGHSLLATRVISRIRSKLDPEIPLRSIFEYPTVASIAGYMKDPEIQETEELLDETDAKTVPVSFAQKRIWFLDKFKGSSSEYNIPGALRIKGELDVDALSSAIQDLVERHESLRTRFKEIEGEPFQVIEPSVPFVLEHKDIGREGTGPDKALVESEVNEFRSHSFILSEAPLFKFRLLKIGVDSYILLRNFHHIIVDGWSLGVFNRELSQAYSARLAGHPCTLEPLPYQYADFSAWQQDRLSGAFLEKQFQYWEQNLKDAPTLLLPTDRPRPTVQSFAGAKHVFRLSKSLSSRLKTFCDGERATAFMSLVAALNVTLSKYSGQTDIILGSPVANRSSLEVENLIGFFVNTLPLRFDLTGNPSFRKLVERVKYASLDAFDHQELPFEKLVERLNPTREMSRHPVFQAVVTVQNAPAHPPELEGVEVSSMAVSTSTTHFDLEFSFVPDGDSWSCAIVYNTDLFHDETISRLSRHFQNLLEGGLKNPDRPALEPCMLDPDEKERLVFGWNQTASRYPKESGIHQLFAEQAERFPDSIALEQANERLTYRELDLWSNSLGNLLVESGVQPGDRVGVYMDRSMSLVASFLGILKAGAAYVPLARDYPDERLRYMIKDAGIKTVMVTEDVPFDLEIDGLSLFRCSQFQNTTEIPSRKPLGIDVEATDPAYIIYTSGSTGKPKGTVIPHRGVVRLVRGQAYADFSPGQRFLLLASPSFDASTFEIWAPLLNGATAAVYHERYLDPALLMDLLEVSDISCIWLTAGLFNLIVDTVPAILQLVDHILTGGEALSPRHVRKALELNPDLRLTNGYGPTECTTFACTHEISGLNQEARSVSIGKPIANTQAYILDSHLEPVPIGVPGELFLGGDGLSLGYLNQPDATSEKFVENPFAPTPGERLYRTGDICRFLPDGNIEFIGRADNQVKVRGFRVEINEIEGIMQGNPAIERAVVHGKQDSTGIVNLVGYYLLKPGNEDFGRSDLRAYFSSRLPEYAIPVWLIQVSDIPLTANGKVDFAALPDPERNAGLDVDVEGRPNTQMETRMIAIWEKLFQRGGVKRTENFFELGGHSLMAARLASEIEKEFGEAIPIASLFESPTVEQLVCRLADDSSPAITRSLVTLQPKGSKNPVFCLHGWGGEVYGFLDLARQLAPDRPVFGLQAVGLDGNSPRHTSVEEMAVHYASEIMNQKANGPYHLIGYSAGGWIAYAVAQELKKRGQQVNLAMLDTSMSSKVPYWMYAFAKIVRLVDRTPYHIRYWIKLPTRDKLAYIRERFRWLKVNLARGSDIMPTVIPREGEEPISRATRKGQPLTRELDYFIRLAGNYKPRPYEGNLTLFSAKGSKWYSRFFWKFMIKGAIDIHYVDGGHHGLIDQYHVGNFSILFKEVLDQIDQR